MKTKYSIQWLTNAFDENKPLKYLYFWGHRKSIKLTVSKSCFSQWYESPFIVNGITYKTTEHWMMANKALLFNDTQSFNQIIECNKPGEAKTLGRQVTGFVEGVWKHHRYQIVILGNIHKFNQNQALGEFLLQTKHRVLVEASPVDTIWGVGLDQNSENIQNVYNWRGLNLLGFALMEVRDFLRTHGFLKNDFTFLPPWVLEPLMDSGDLFWRMGKGEEIIIQFLKSYKVLTTEEKLRYKLFYPSPIQWMLFYGDE